MSSPTLTVEIAFGYPSMDEAPVWTDVSAYVMHSPPVQIVRGRTSERSVYSAGTARVTLKNQDRRFDQTYSSGPYFGDLKPGVRIRIRATADDAVTDGSGMPVTDGSGSPVLAGTSTTYDLFSGWVTGWPVDITDNGYRSTVTIDCVDAIGWLNRARVSQDAYGSYAASIANLDLHLRYTDDYNWKDDVGTNNASLAFGRRDAGASLTDGSSAAALRFDGSTLWQLATPVANYFNGSMSFWIQTSVKPEEAGFYGGAEIGIFGNATKSVPGPVYYGVQVNINTDGQLVWRYVQSVGSGSVQTLRAINDGQPHHVVLVSGASAALTKVYIDGVEQTYSATSGTALPALGLFVLGNASNEIDGTYPGAQMFTGSLQDVCLWDVALSASQVQALYDYGRGWFEESTADRVDRVLDDVSWPAAWRSISSGLESSCGRLVLGGRTGLAMLQEIERTEQGYLFAAADGDVTLLQRYHHLEDTEGTTAQVVFSDDGAGVGFSGSFGFRYDDLDIRNDVIVDAPPLGFGRASDLTSITEYGAQGFRVDTVLPTTQSAADMATGLSYKYASPAWRSKQMVVYPAVGYWWGNVLGLELADRITQEITPVGVGSQVSKDMLVGRIEWLIGADGAWELTVLGEPVPPDFFVLDSSALDGPDPLGF